MGRSVREPLPGPPARERRPELIRPATRRRDFPLREAQRVLQRKETPWAPIAYGVFLAGILLILFFAYSSYAFSKYRGEILPGVQVDQIRVGGLTEGQAENALYAQLAVIHRVPLALNYGAKSWRPSAELIGLSWRVKDTAQEAMAVGREGSIVQQWIDRLPFHPVHAVPLLYYLNEHRLHSYLLGIAASPDVNQPIANAALSIDAQNGYHVVLQKSKDGTRLNMGQAEQAVHNSLGSLSSPSEALEVDRIQPAINDSAANRVRSQVEAFLDHPPVIALGKRVILAGRADFGPMLSFRDVVGKGNATIKMTVDPSKVRAYVASLAAQVDRPAQNAKLNFAGSQVSVIQPQQNGRSLDQQYAFNKLLPIITGLHVNARLHLPVAVIPPPIDQSNPASLGIRQLIGTGFTSFAGAGAGRLADIEAIANALNQDLLAPHNDISFNTLAGTNWSNQVYSDSEHEAGGQLVPSRGGAMQQVATTFLRALYDAGLKLEERHAHVYRLPWYEPPIGYDAVVAPGRNWDLRFANTTGRYLLIETRVEPIRQELYIYVYGPKLGWHVSVDTQGKVTKVYPHGRRIEKVDPSLLPGQVHQIAWATDGADTVVQRVITFPNGAVHTDEIDTHYDPSRAIITIGNAAPTATPTPHPGGTTTPTPTPTPGSSATPSPGPTATATFNH